jgi:hypothetical protein
MAETPWFIVGPEAARKVALPSRAFMHSWREQTLPARRAALTDSQAHFEELDDPAKCDLALAALIGDALQPIEDLAHLGRAWDEPFTGLANYIRATTYSSRTATNFWGAKWDDARIKVFAGLYARKRGTDELISMVPPEVDAQLTLEQREVMAAAEEATVRRLRLLLGVLGKDWRQFSPYYNAYKHGGLLVTREDVIWVDDDVQEVTDATPTHRPSLAAWDLRDEEGAVRGDFQLSSAEVADTAARSGRLAIDLLERFVESRSAIFDSVDFNLDGSVAGVREMSLPLTVWLREADLSAEQWKVIGRGPRITLLDETTSPENA